MGKVPFSVFHDDEKDKEEETMEVIRLLLPKCHIVTCGCLSKSYVMLFSKQPVSEEDTINNTLMAKEKKLRLRKRSEHGQVHKKCRKWLSQVMHPGVQCAVLQFPSTDVASHAYSL